MRANIPLNISLYQYGVPGRRKPLIIHAPSNPLIKGTDFIKKTLDELREEGIEFDFHLVENMPNPELRKLLTSADIVVDELYGDTVGVLSTEGMATGNAVLTHYPADFAGVPDDCPAVNITERNLKDLLRRAILDMNWRRDLAEGGRKFVESHYDSIKVAGQILSWLEQVDDLSYDFYPDFHLEYATNTNRQRVI
jgi:glycosyltransferase involved in cell wall biosynthesis